jgi:hypothetical protein
MQAVSVRLSIHTNTYGYWFGYYIRACGRVCA